MVKFKIGSYYYAPFNINIASHKKFLAELNQELDADGELLDILGDINYMFDNAYISLDSFNLNNPNPYLILDEFENILGFIYMYINYKNECVLYLALHKDYRSTNKHHGSVVSKELTDYILANFPIEGIVISIDPENLRSIKAALAAGFTQVDDIHYLKGR